MLRTRLAAARKTDARRILDEELEPPSDAPGLVPRGDRRRKDDDDGDVPNGTPATLQRIFRDRVQISSRLIKHLNPSSKKKPNGRVYIEKIENIQVDEKWRRFLQNPMADLRPQLPLVDKAAIPEGQTALRLGGLGASWR